MIITQDWTNIQQWERMCAFYTLPTSQLSLPSSSPKGKKLLGMSILWWTMWQPTLKEPWRWRYAWTDLDTFHDDELPIDNQNIQGQLSNSMWSTRLCHDHPNWQTGMGRKPHHMGRR